MTTYEMLKQCGMYSDVLSVISDYSVGDKKYWKSKFTDCIKHINRKEQVYMCKYNQVKSLYIYELKKTLKEKKMTTKKKMLEYFSMNNIHITYASQMKKDELFGAYSLRKMRNYLVDECDYNLTGKLFQYYKNN